MDRCPSEAGQVRPEAAGERPSHEGGATTTAEVKAQGPPQSAGAVRGSERTTVRKSGMVDVRPAKDGAHRGSIPLTELQLPLAELQQKLTTGGIFRQWWTI